MSIDVDQNSKRLSELENEIPNDDDYIIIERHGSTKQSYKITYKNFKKQISQYISIASTKDMIHCDKNDFSKFAHGHEYSNFNIFPSYGLDSNNKTEASTKAVKLGTFNIRTFKQGIDQEYPLVSKRLYEPYAKDVVINELNNYKPNHVGDLKFIAVRDFRDYLTEYLGYTLDEINGIQNIKINKKFDGWVIPNGATYTCSSNSFREACSLFEGNSNATSFTVPNLNYFIQAKSSGGKYEYHAFQSGLQKHSHGINGSAYGDTIKLELPPFEQTSTRTANSSDNYNSLHGGKGGQCTAANCGQVAVTITEVKLNNLMINKVEASSSGNSEETYPSYIGIPCLVYIGDES